MTRDGARPPTTRRRGWLRLEWRHELAKPPADPPPPGPKDNRPGRGPVQPSRPNPRDPDSLPDPRPGRVLYTVVGLLLLARHRSAEPAGEPLGSRRYDPRHAAGDWHPPRDEPATPGWPGGRRPTLRTNLEDPK